MKHSNTCSVCREIELIKKKSNPYFVKELTTGYIVLGKYQFFHGYTLFLCKYHANELHELPQKTRLQFLKEMSIAAEAVYKAYKPKKLNYELLGNTVSHLHWHLFPRYENDPLPKRPIWCIARTRTMAGITKPSEKELHSLKRKLSAQLKKIYDRS